MDVEGLDGILERIDDLVDIPKIESAMGKCVALVERSAKQKAPKDVGTLRNSITSEVKNDGDNVVGVVFTPEEYAPYVEYGTGIHAEKGDGSSGWWVYVKGGKKTGNGPAKHYTEEKAKQICAILRSKGLEAYATDGNEPKPFLRPALNENREKIANILKGSISE